MLKYTIGLGLMHFYFLVNYPTEQNNYLIEHVLDINNSYRQLTLNELIPDSKTHEQFARQLFHAPFALVSHDTAVDPVFNYANLKALELFESTWENFTRLPSRLSAEPIHRADRDRLLAEVSKHGYINRYEGVRVSSSGRRFLIKNAKVWNLFDKKMHYIGQAACFDEWEYL
jgi:hypothetical protein